MRGLNSSGSESSIDSGFDSPLSREGMSPVNRVPVASLSEAIASTSSLAHMLVSMTVRMCSACVSVDDVNVCPPYLSLSFLLLLSHFTHVLQNRLSISSPVGDFCPCEDRPHAGSEHEYPVFCGADLSGDQGPSSEVAEGQSCDHMTSPWYNGTPYGCYPQHVLGQQQSYGCSGLDFPSLFEPSLLSEKQYYPRPLGLKPVSVMNIGTLCVCVCESECVSLSLCTRARRGVTVQLPATFVGYFSPTVTTQQYIYHLYVMRFHNVLAVMNGVCGWC